MQSKTNSNIYLLIRAEIRRIAWDLGKHLTLFVSAAALVALFFYIFKDFVGEQLATLSPTTSQRGLNFLGFMGAILSGVSAATMSRNLMTPPRSFLPFMTRTGASSSSIKRHIQGTILLPVILAACCAGIWAYVLGASHIVLCMFVPPVILSLRSKNLNVRIQKRPFALRLRMTEAPLRITDWRMYQILNHAMPGRGFMILAIAGACVLPFAALIRPHPFLLQTLALCVGVIASFGIVYAVAADLPGAWFERQAGLTHKKWSDSWQKIANYLSVILVISGLIALLISSSETRMQILALPIIAGFLPWLIPSLVLQIDGRARGTNLMVAVLVGLFIGTAMIATPWAALVVPILKSQAAGYQNGRFYRA